MSRRSGIPTSAGLPSSRRLACSLKTKFTHGHARRFAHAHPEVFQLFSFSFSRSGVLAALLSNCGGAVMPVKRRKLASPVAIVVTPVEQIAPRAFTIRQAAAYLNVSVWAIRDLLRRGEIKRVPLPGKKFLIDRTDLDVYFEALKKAA